METLNLRRDLEVMVSFLSPRGFRDNFTTLEKEVLAKGKTKEEVKNEVSYKTQYGSIASKVLKSNGGIKIVTKDLSIYNGKFLVVDENHFTKTLSEFKKMGLGGTNGPATKKYAIYNIYVKPDYKDRVVSALDRLGVDKESVNYLSDDPDPSTGGVMKYSVGVVSSSSTDPASASGTGNSSAPQPSTTSTPVR